MTDKANRRRFAGGAMRASFFHGGMVLALACAASAQAQGVTDAAKPDPSPQPPAAVTPAPAPPAAKSPDSGSWLSWKHASGDWGGLRNRLYNDGIDIVGHYVSESAGNTGGGNGKGVRYSQEINVGIAFDLDKLLGLSGGKANFVYTKRNGQNLSNDKLGNLGSVQEIYGAGLDDRVEELTYTQTLAKGRLQIKAGWYPLGNDFATDLLNCDFQNNAFCGHTDAMSGDSNWRNYPTAQMGIRALVRPLPDVYVQAGVFRGNKDNYNHGIGFDIGFAGQGVIIPFEIGYQPGGHQGKKLGNYKIGGYYDTSSAPDVKTDINGGLAGLTGAPFAQRDGRWGAYALFNQSILHVKGSETRGLAVKGAVAFGDPRTAKYGYTGDIGLVFQGPLAHRASDYFGVIVGVMHINDRKTDYQREALLLHPAGQQPQTTETIIEADYGIQVAQWLLLRPDFQYIIRPAGTGKIPNATVFGLTVKATI